MITGDYHHTAVAVAKDVGMVKAASQVVVIDTIHTDAVQHDGSAASTPDMSNSGLASPDSSPPASFRRHNADFGHGFFGLFPGSSKSLGSDAEADKLGQSLKSRNTSLVRVEEVEGRATSLGLEPGHRVSFELSQPSRGSFHGKQLSSRAMAVLKLPVGAALANNVASEAATHELSPRTRLSLDSTPSAEVPAPSKLPLQSMKLPSEAAYPTHTQSQRLPSRAVSLTRLPSEAAASMAALSAVSSCDGSSVSDRQHLSMQSLERQMLGLSHHVIHASKTTLLTHPFHRRTWDAPLTTKFGVAPESGLRGLTFTSGADRHHMEPGEAFTAMTEGRLQCAVTGDAFEQLLQLSDVSLLEAVMRNAVVFSRMQPHQKGQVMDLLGSRGIHQPFEGHPRHIQVDMILRPVNLQCVKSFCSLYVAYSEALMSSPMSLFGFSLIFLRCATVNWTCRLCSSFRASLTFTVFLARKLSTICADRTVLHACHLRLVDRKCITHTGTGKHHHILWGWG